MTPAAVHESGQLLRLRTLRERAAWARAERCREARWAPFRAVQAREREIADLRTAQADLLRWAADIGPADLPRVARFADARREALSEALERAEFELIDERSALAKTDQALAEALARWRRAQGHGDAVAALHADAQRALRRERERRAEAEIDGLVRWPDANDTRR